MGNSIDIKIKELREQLYQYSDKYDLTDKKVVDISQKLDKFMIIKQREELEI